MSTALPVQDLREVRGTPEFLGGLNHNSSSSSSGRHDSLNGKSRITNNENNDNTNSSSESRNCSERVVIIEISRRIRLTVVIRL